MTMNDDYYNSVYKIAFIFIYYFGQFQTMHALNGINRTNGTRQNF
jgi:hypothetical protein